MNYFTDRHGLPNFTYLYLLTVFTTAAYAPSKGEGRGRPFGPAPESATEIIRTTAAHLQSCHSFDEGRDFVYPVSIPRHPVALCGVDSPAVGGFTTDVCYPRSRQDVSRYPEVGRWLFPGTYRILQDLMVQYAQVSELYSHTTAEGRSITVYDREHDPDEKSGQSNLTKGRIAPVNESFNHL